MYKYLYGKWSILKGLVEGESPIRLCDIRHYARLENENMRDDELIKSYNFSPYEVLMSFDGVEIPAESLAQDTKFDVPVRPCVCLCLSNKKNDSVLFDKFQADVCIEINAEYLIGFFKHVFEEKLKGKVVADNIQYYPKNAGVKCLDYENAVFTKPDFFEHEDEFRIAGFLPYDEKTVFNLNGESHLAFKECNCTREEIESGQCNCFFVFLNTGLKDGFKSYIGEISIRN